MRALRIAMVGVLALPILVLAQKTSYDYAKSGNFASYKTYTVREGTKVGNPLIDDRIAAAIDDQMKAKGFTKANNADVAVVYHIAFDKEKNIQTWSTGAGYGPYGYGWGGGWGMTSTDVRVNEILVGTLAIDMADLKTNQMVWRGLGVKEIDTNAKPEKRDKNISKAVEKIFKNYPPKIKG